MSVALVLSGGGSKGDFQLGAIRYLYEFKGIKPTLIVGTSVGSINAAKLAEGEGSPDSGLRGLAHTWYTLDKNEDMWRYEAWIRDAPPELKRFIQDLGDRHLFSRLLPSAPSLLPPDHLDAGGMRDLLNGTTNLFFLIGAGMAYGPTIASAAEAASVANLEPIRDRSLDAMDSR